MSKPDLQFLNKDNDRQLLTEILIPSEQGLEIQVADHVARILKQFDLEPRQLSHILSAVDQALQSLEEGFTPLHLRISISGLDQDEKLLEGSPDQEKNPEFGGKGLGFFLVKRIVGQLLEPESEKYRLLEILIYRD